MCFARALHSGSWRKCTVGLDPHKSAAYGVGSRGWQFTTWSRAQADSLDRD